MPPFPEMLVSVFLTAIASAAMGLFVSSLFTNADRAMTVAPILLMPQILFSDLIFKLEGTTKIISWLAVCRWSMEGMGTTANLNDLAGGVAQDMFTYSVSHLLRAWGILLGFTVACLVLSRLVLLGIGREKS